jgi:hypothetical protein
MAGAARKIRRVGEKGWILLKVLERPREEIPV